MPGKTTKYAGRLELEQARQVAVDGEALVSIDHQQLSAAPSAPVHDPAEVARIVSGGTTRKGSTSDAVIDAVSIPRTHATP